MIGLGNRLTIKEILQRTTEHFAEYGISTPRLDAEVLLADLLGIERIELYVQFDRPLKKGEIDEYRERVVQRSKRVPVAYIIGYQEFMSLDFKVNQDVLIPRPETEHLVERIVKKITTFPKDELTVVELCTGSGAIIISLARQLIDLEIEKKINYIATDISEAALKVAKENAKKHDILGQIEFRQGDLFAAIKGLDLEIDYLISNPPYIPEDEIEDLQSELQYEPDTALKAGEDGLEFYRRIIIGGKKLLQKGGVIGLELGNQQDSAVKDLLLENGFNNVEVVNDYSEIPRVIFASKN